MCSLAEGIEYKGILKGIEKGMLKGIEKGRSEGMLKGIEKGRSEGKLEGIQQGMLKGQVEGQLSLLLNQINNHIISKEDAFKSINDNKLKEELIKRLDNKSIRGI